MLQPYKVKEVRKMTRKWVSTVYAERKHMENHTQRRAKPSTIN